MSRQTSAFQTQPPASSALPGTSKAKRHTQASSSITSSAAALKDVAMNAAPSRLSSLLQAMSTNATSPADPNAPLPPPPATAPAPPPPHDHDEDNDDEDEDEDYPTLPGQIWMEGDSLAPPCQSDLEIVPEVISLANITATDVFYDLGCGDGRVCIAVAKATGARAKGVEIEVNLLERFRARLVRAEVGGGGGGGGGGAEGEQQQASRALRKGQVEVVGQDLLTVDLKDASVIYLYLLPEGIQALRPRIEAWLEGGEEEREKEEREEEEEKGTDKVTRSMGSIDLNDEKRQRRAATRRLVCNTWGLPGRPPTAKRDVGHLANVRLLFYESSSSGNREDEGREEGGER